MDFNEWNNYTAIGYLKYALEDYNRIANQSENELRPLTEDEQKQIIGSLHYAFDMKTLKEAYDHS